MSLTAMTVVFIALILLYLIFRTIGKTMSRRNVRKEQPRTAAPVPVMVEEEASAEEIAAISLALHQYYEELEHREWAVLTINRVARTYSPWSSKLYGLTQTPNKK
jgi:sodium pump decarboxylase gamma subunit